MKSVVLLIHHGYAVHIQVYSRVINHRYLAEGVGFEPTGDFRLQQFSRLPP